MASLSTLKIRLFFTAWMVFALFFSTNIVREHYPAFSLVQQGTFRVDEYQGLHSDIFVHTDGHSYIGNNVASSVIAALPLAIFDPFLDALEARSKQQLAQGKPPTADYRVDKPNRQQFFKEVSQRGLALRFGASAAITSILLIAPLSALCVVAMFQMLQDRGVRQGLAAWLALLFAFGTPLFFRSAHLTNNIFVMYFVFAAFWILWPRQPGAQPASALGLVLAGFCAGMALACDYSGLIPLVCLAGYALFRQLDSEPFWPALRVLFPFSLGAIFPILFLLYSQWAMYGNPFLPGQYWMPDVNYTERGWRGFAGPSPEVFLLNLLHPSYGLLLFAPLLGLGLLPLLRSSARDILPSKERWFIFVFVTLFLLFCAANQYSLMQFNTGFRYLLPLVPFLYLAACERLSRLSWPVLLLVSIPVILHGVVLGMARDCNPNDDNWRYAPTLTAFLGQLHLETVPASYLRIWNEGLQLPWLRVLRLTAPVDHPYLNQPWLPLAILSGGGLLVAAIWTVGRRSVTVPETSMSAKSEKPLPTVAVVVPVLNEAHVLEKSIRTLRAFLQAKFPYPTLIVVADNGSTDGTGEIAHELTQRFDDVKLISLSQRGRGRALRKAWSDIQADIFAYMDVDLSTELEALEKLCRSIHEEGYDIATGSRLLPQSRTTRCLKREVLSRGYNLLIKCVLFTHFSDAQCGFKAISRRVVREVLPLIQNQHWFFDTELLVLGEKLGYRVKDVPVKWIEDTDSRVKILSTVWEDIKGVFRLRWLLWSGKLRGHRKIDHDHAAQQPQAVASDHVLPCLPSAK